MSMPLRIGIAGLGTVGGGVIKMIAAHADKIAARAGRPIQITAVSSRDPKKNRGFDVSGFAWEEFPAALALRTDVDVVVETIGGENGVAKDLIESALKNKKHVVTANKALLAKHGYALATFAEANNVSLFYEAAVAGGIPVIKALREGYAGNEIRSISGILNGTCNYILTEMRETGRAFDDVLRDAQAHGYAEADPTFDIDGIDAAHKLHLLSALAFGVKSDFSAMDIKGIRGVSAEDIVHAQELGFKIKLLGLARRLDNGKIAQSLEPCLVPVDAPLGSVEGVFNAVFIEGDFVGPSMLEGRGAGEGPTASSILSDLVDLARGRVMPVYGVPVDVLTPMNAASVDEIIGEQYLRLVVLDQPGVIADVAAILRDYGISIETMLQRGRDPGQPVSIVLMTHACSRAAIRAALDKIGRLTSVNAPPVAMRIERF